MITKKFEEKQAILTSKFTNTTTNKFKQSVWEEVTIAVNAVGATHRSVAKVKEKCTNLQSSCREPVKVPQGTKGNRRWPTPKAAVSDHG